MTIFEYPWDTDLFWLAIDLDGYVGAFSTAGSGPVPMPVLEPENDLEDLWDPVFVPLPKVSTALVKVVSSGKKDDWIGFAERGVFAYDWSDVHRADVARIHAYELIAMPSVPITVDALPPELGRIARSIRFDGVTFGQSPVLDVTVHTACLTDPREN